MPRRMRMIETGEESLNCCNETSDWLMVSTFCSIIGKQCGEDGTLIDSWVPSVRHLESMNYILLFHYAVQKQLGRHPNNSRHQPTFLATICLMIHKAVGRTGTQFVGRGCLTKILYGPKSNALRESLDRNQLGVGGAPCCCWR